ncbi:hypothetical protein K227x_54000 [Rubripirellula lacrimiformis]|uniref:Uncharacterized protein n=1 Tax=Rubripirellula lacrimiformis TaxID=1930273 RepID=A0A517NIL2_9BACT|nr:hypothetical protein [Rubripirellula lacrimiformis]QDT06976.1 hypothetical protein K227x_54000 [Rubripirellula lacrimiformis]
MSGSPEQDDSVPQSAQTSLGFSQKGSGRIGGKSKAGGIAVIALVAIYSFSAPMLNERFGWSLPAVQTDRDGNVRMADSASDAKGGGTKTGDTSAVGTNPSNAKTTGDTVDRSSSPMSTATANDSPTAGGAGSATGSDDLLHGLLKEVSPNRYLSPAGLLYTPGSAEGHRLEHLRRHTKDDPGRPGSHGVFDGDMEGALVTIDRAYERAKKNQRTTKKVDDGRTIYTVDMGGRIGFVGGRDGKRKRNPMARRVRIVLDGDRVITAYPM